MSISCQEFVELVTDYLEDTMNPELKKRFEDHLAECPGCKVYLDQIRETIRHAGRLAGDDLSPPAKEALLEAFGHWRSG